MEQENNIDYLIKPNEAYELIRNDYNGRTYYKIPVTTTNFKGEQVEGFKNVIFTNNDLDLENGALIKIKSGYEGFYYRRGDKYNPIFNLVITDFECVNGGNAPKPTNSNDYAAHDEENFDDF